MTEVADRFVVVLDANVLYPFRIRDVLLRFAEAGLFRARWSEQILNEWSASLLTTKPHLEASIRSQCDAMAHAFPEAMIEGHDALIPALDLPDPDDRHVLAAAIRAGAQHIVTANLKDFPAEALAPYGVEAVSHAFLAATYELYPRQATATLRRMRRAYHKPPMSANELLLDLMRVGLPQLAALVRQEIEML